MSLALLFVLSAAPVAAQTVIDSDETVIGTGGGTQSSPWNIPYGSVRVGVTGDGSITVSEGGEIRSSGPGSASLDLGFSAGTHASVVVTGAGSSWRYNSTVRVGASGTGTLSVTDGGEFSASVLHVGEDGVGSVTVSDGATLTVLQANGVTLGQNLGSQGTLNIGAAAGEAAAAAGLLDVDRITGGAGTGTLVFNHTDAGYVVSLPLEGSLQVSVLAGTTILTGTNSFSGGTTIGSEGVLQIGNGATDGVLPGTVVNDGVLAFDRSDAVTFGGTVSGSGVLRQDGSGVLTLAGAHSYTGGTAVNTGTLRLGAAERLADSGGVSVAAGATFDLDGFDETIGGLSGAGAVVLGAGSLTAGGAGDSTFSGTITGTGGLTKAGSGTLTLAGTNSHAGGTVISGGTLRIGNGATDGVLPGNVVNDGVLAFDRSDAVTFGGTVSGSGALRQDGSGVLTLAAAHSYTGGTAVNAGTLRLGAAERLADSGGLSVAAGATFDLDGFDETIGGLSGAGAVVLGAGSLTAGGAGDSTFSGTITGTGGLTKAGSGTLTLAGESSYSGGTTVAAGRLVVDGGIGDLTLMPDATLGGSGTIGRLVAAGRIAPGNSIGTLSTGPVTFQSGSVYAVEIADDGTADRLEVAGTAVIEPGATVEVTPLPGSYRDGERYSIISTSDGIEGSFDSLGYVAGQTLTFDLSLLQEGNELLLLLERNRVSFADQVTDPLYNGTAEGLDFLEGSGDPDEDPLFQELFALGEGSQLDDAVRQLSGAGIGGATQTALSGTQSVLHLLPSGGGGSANAGLGSGGQSLTLAQFALGDSGASDLLVDSGLGRLPAAETGAATERRSSVWFQGVGGWGERDGTDGLSSVSRRYAGVAGGLHGELQEDLELGLALSRIEGRSETSDGLAETESTSLMAALHGSWTPGALRLGAALGVARHDFDSERHIRFGGFQETATGDHVGYEVVGDLGATYDWRTGGLTVSPTAGISTSWLTEEAWEESGAGSANLSIGEAETLTVQPRLGVGLAYALAPAPDLVLTPRAQALWLGRFGDSQTSYSARFAGAGPSWQVPGLEEPRHSAAVSLGAELESLDGWGLVAGYAGRFGEGAQDHGFLLGGSLRF